MMRFPGIESRTKTLLEMLVIHRFAEIADHPRLPSPSAVLRLPRCPTTALVGRELKTAHPLRLVAKIRMEL
jgi:hypothetical protein